jgi:hypothetical protein
MRNKQLIAFFRYAAIVGNIVLLVWFSFIRINEEFKGNLIQKFSSVGLIGLLATNIFLLLMPDKPLISFLRYAAIVGNIVFLLWILSNGIKEGFKAPTEEKFYYIGVMALLAISSLCLFNRTSESV